MKRQRGVDREKVRMGDRERKLVGYFKRDRKREKVK